MVLINVALLLVQSSTAGILSVDNKDLLAQIDWAIVIIYTIEMLLRIFALGCFNGPTTYLRSSGYNVVDFLIVVSTYIVLYLNSVHGHDYILFRLGTLRVFRAVVCLRDIKLVTSIVAILDALGKSVPSLVDVIKISGLFLIFYGLSGIQLFGGSLKRRCVLGGEHVVMEGSIWELDLELLDQNANMTLVPEDIFAIPDTYCGAANEATVTVRDGDVKGFNCLSEQGHQCAEADNPYYGRVNFDHFGFAVLTMFTVITFEGWDRIMYSIIDSEYSLSSLYFVSMIIIFSYFLISIFVAAISGIFLRLRKEHQNLLALKKKKKSFANTGMRTQESRRGGFFNRFKLSSDGSKKKKSSTIYPSDSTDGNMNGFGNLGKNSVGRESDESGFSMGGGTLSTESSMNGEQSFNGRESDSSPKRQMNSFGISSMPLSNSYESPSTTPREKWYNKSFDSFDFVHRGVFDKISSIVIVVNVFIMMTYRYDQSTSFATMMWAVELVILGYMFIEIVMLVLGHGLKGFYDSGHNMDVIIVTVSIVGHVTGLWSNLTTFRLFKFFRSKSPSRKSTKRSSNPGTLAKIMSRLDALVSLFVFFFTATVLFALLGMQFFSGKLSINGVEPRANFNSFGDAMLTVFQVSTGEQWIDVMYNAMRVHWVSPIFFVVIFVFLNYLVLNLIIAVILENLELKDKQKQQRQKMEIWKRLRMKPEHSSKFIDVLELIRVYAYLFLKRKPATLANKWACSARLKASYDFPSHRVLGQSQVEEVLRMKGDIGREKDSRTAKKGQLRRMNRRSMKTVSVLDSNSLREGRRASITSTDVLKMINKVDGDVMPLPSWLEDTSFFIFKKGSAVRNGVAKLLVHKWYKAVSWIMIGVSIVGVIFTEPVGSPVTKNEPMTDMINLIVVAFFGFDLFLKTTNKGLLLCPGSYLSSGFNRTDCFIYLIDVSTVIVHQGIGSEYFVRTVRMGLALRCLRALGQSDTLQKLVVALFKSVKSILSIFLLGGAIFLSFGVIGVRTFGGAYYRCNDLSVDGYNDCIGVFEDPVSHLLTPRVWDKPNYNFDNIGKGFLTLFEVSSLDEWLNVLYPAMDMRGDKLQPRADESWSNSIFFVLFICIGSFFIVRTFIGVFIDQFGYVSGSKLLTEKQKLWRDMHRLIFNIKLSKAYEPPSTKFNKFCYNFVTAKLFGRIVSYLVLLNTAFLACFVYSQPDSWGEFLRQVDVVFTLIFTIEAILKIFAFYGISSERAQQEKHLAKKIAKKKALKEALKAKKHVPVSDEKPTSTKVSDFEEDSINMSLENIDMKGQEKENSELSDLEEDSIDASIIQPQPREINVRWSNLSRFFNSLGQYTGSKWNVFELLIVVGSLLTLKNTPLLMILGRPFRFVRIFRVIRYSRNLSMLMNTIISSLGAMFNIILLLVMVIFVYAGVGTQLFVNIKYGPYLTRQVNFKSFANSFLVLFQVMTGEGWRGIMNDCKIVEPFCTKEVGSFGEDTYDDCGFQLGATAYFTSFVILCTYIFTNLFVAAILDFITFGLLKETSLVTARDVHKFVHVWSKFDKSSLGYIGLHEVKPFFLALGYPLGTRKIKGIIWRRIMYEVYSIHHPNKGIPYQDLCEILVFNKLGNGALTYDLLIQREKEFRDIMKNGAAHEIQRYFRGWSCRRKLALIKSES